MVIAKCVLVSCLQRFSRLGHIRTLAEGPLDEGGNDHCSYFVWLDEEEVKGWPKMALIQAREEIREKKKRINELTATVNELSVTVNELTATVNGFCMELEQRKVKKPASLEMVVYRRCIIM
ncbi:unnamed protein product [Eruca vesicaria subsp. sativa]|uniref:Uncharacterized protein n=1 Tax=Eruca vesicaria subsp. sativa TaxID=29727 RepID=A0ABC8IT16_ERUVS|nr:unnamed protein product [Eruca vesicaria subsp. sativa]